MHVIVDGPAISFYVQSLSNKHKLISVCVGVASSVQTAIHIDIYVLLHRMDHWELEFGTEEYKLSLFKYVRTSNIYRQIHCTSKDVQDLSIIQE